MTYNDRLKTIRQIETPKGETGIYKAVNYKKVIHNAIIITKAYTKQSYNDRFETIRQI